MRLSDGQRLDWLRLIRSESVGPRTFRSLVNRFGSAAEALAALPDIARRSGRGSLAICSREAAEKEMAAGARMGVHLVASGEPDYPPALAATADAPPLIGVRGNLSVLAKAKVGIVGSRNASALGRKFAERLAAGLGEAEFATVSGLARGIDTSAHRASLRTGTIAVLAGGHRRIYPPDNEGLLEELLDHGAAISEMPLDWEARARDFPRRNRIVSGLSLGVVVVEAARRSGSLITARFALEQGRDVFAVPGSPLDPRSEGTNDLLHQGAILCRSAQDIIDALRPQIERTAPPGQLFEAMDGDEAAGETFWDELDLDGFGEPEADGRPLQTWAPAFDDDGPGDRPARTGTPRPAASSAAFQAPGDELPDDPCRHLVDLLGATPLTIDELIRLSGLPAGQVQQMLMDLQIQGRVERHGPSGVTLVL